MGEVSTTRPVWRPNAQTSMSGGSTPSVVRAVQIWLRWSVPWWIACGEPDTDRGVPLVALLVDVPHHGVGVEVLGEELDPRPFVGLHLGPELPETQAVRVDSLSRIAGQVRQVVRVRSDEVTHRFQDRAVGPGDRCFELLR